MGDYDFKGKQTRTFVSLPGFKKIVAWQAASDLAAQVNTLARTFGPGYFRLGDQMRSSASAISANIAEGYCSGYLGNYIRHSEIARGSAGELGSYLQDCEQWNLLTGQPLDTIVKQYGFTTYLIGRLLQALKKKEQDGTWDRGYPIKEPSSPYLTEQPSSTDNPTQSDYTDEQLTGLDASWPDSP